MKSKKGTVAAIAVIIVLVGIVCIGLLRDFDAQGYVRAILNQRFLGYVTEAEEILEDTSKKELLKQYDEGIESFVSDYITNGVEIDSELEKKPNFDFFPANCEEKGYFTMDASVE